MALEPLDYALVGMTLGELQETAEALHERLKRAEAVRVPTPISPALLEAERKARYYLARRRAR